MQSLALTARRRGVRGFDVDSTVAIFNPSVIVGGQGLASVDALPGLAFLSWLKRARASRGQSLALSLVVARYFVCRAERSCIAPRYAATHSGIGVFSVIQLLGVDLFTPVLRQKSACFQCRASSAAANDSGVKV